MFARVSIVARAGAVAARRVQPVKAATVPARTWFGFGQPQEEAPVGADVPMYKRIPYDDIAEHSYIMPAAERADRDAISAQLQAVPAGEKPSLDVVVAMFDVLMKHNDRLAVQSSMGVCVELGIELSDSYQAKLAEFLEKAQVQAYHEGGDW